MLVKRCNVLSVHLGLFLIFIYLCQNGNQVPICALEVALKIILRYQSSENQYLTW